MSDRKRLRDLSLIDDFLFNLFMQEKDNEELLKGVLERLLGKKIAEIRIREKQHAIITDPDYHGTRLDAYVRDIDGNVYNVEVQNTNTKDLEYRIRFYLSLIDKENMPSGEYDYNKLPKTIIILVCNFDYFKKGLYRYTFKNRCLEDASLFLNDGVTKIVLNTKGTNPVGVSEDTVNLLKYFASSFTETADTLGDPFIKKLDKLVSAIKNNSKNEGDFMRLEERLYRNRKEGREEGRAEGRKEGRKEGRAEGRAEGIGIGEVKATIRIYSRMGKTDKEIADYLKTDLMLSDEAARNYIDQYRPRS